MPSALSLQGGGDIDSLQAALIGRIQTVPEVGPERLLTKLLSASKQQPVPAGEGGSGNCVSPVHLQQPEEKAAQSPSVERLWSPEQSPEAGDSSPDSAFSLPDAIQAMVREIDGLLTSPDAVSYFSPAHLQQQQEDEDEDQSALLSPPIEVLQWAVDTTCWSDTSSLDFLSPADSKAEGVLRKVLPRGKPRRLQLGDSRRPSVHMSILIVLATVAVMLSGTAVYITAHNSFAIAVNNRQRLVSTMRLEHESVQRVVAEDEEDIDVIGPLKEHFANAVSSLQPALKKVPRVAAVLLGRVLGCAERRGRVLLQHIEALLEKEEVRDAIANGI